MEEKFLDGKVIVCVGNITKQTTDAIVNAANSTLRGGGGVDGAIHEAGGPLILEACEEIRRTRFLKGLPTGQAVITTAGNLPAKYVIHTVGPIFGIDKENEAGLLADCYRNSLQLAVENDLKSISFPSISTGVYYYPKDRAAEISSLAIKEFLAGDSDLREIRLVFFSEPDARTFLRHHCF